MRRRTFISVMLASAAAPATAAAQITLGGDGLGGPTPPHISPENELERTLIDATYFDPSQRQAFPHVLLRSEVAIAMVSDAPDSEPMIVTTSAGQHCVAMFTSPARLSSVLGPAVQQLVLTGRQALQRYHDKSIALNEGLAPYIVLEADDITRYLAMTD